MLPILKYLPPPSICPRKKKNIPKQSMVYKVLWIAPSYPVRQDIGPHSMEFCFPLLCQSWLHPSAYTLLVIISPHVKNDVFYLFFCLTFLITFLLKGNGDLLSPIALMKDKAKARSFYHLSQHLTVGNYPFPPCSSVEEVKQNSTTTWMKMLLNCSPVWSRIIQMLL